MTHPPVVHGSFSIQREYEAPLARVFAAWADADLKARWFIGPPERWRLVERKLDLRVGGSELLHGQFDGGPSTIFRARYHDIIPDQRLIYVYDMHHGGRHLSISLASVEFTAISRTRTRMAFTEQAVFLDGEDGTASRERGTAVHFDRLGSALDDPHEIVSSRVLAAPRVAVFGAISDPAKLARWWGPQGFSNTFSEFDLRTGGAWRLVMRAPDGTEYPMLKEFIDVSPPERIVLEHRDPVHAFRMTMTLLDVGDLTQLVWSLRFESEAEAERVRPFVVAANEQNFDRLEAVLREP
jgi:uncharacterized protein YndB with AHSA1/START domain